MQHFPLRLIDLNYYCHGDIINPDAVLQIHAPSDAYASYMQEKAHVNFVKHANCETSITHNGTPFYFFRSRNRFWYIPFATTAFVKKQLPGIVLVQGLVFPLQVIWLKWKLGKKVKIIAQHHGERPFSGLKGLFQRIADKSIAAYLFTSHGNAAEWIDKGVVKHKSKCHEILEASVSFAPKNKTHCRQELGLNAATIFLWVGRLHPLKDPLTVLTAFEQFIENNNGTALYMIYQTDELLPLIKAMLGKNRKLKNAVHLIGQVPHNNLEYWYSAADFFVSGSHKEGSGYALLEAMACGCFPVVSNIPTFKKITGYGKAGILFRKADANALALVLEQSIAFKNDSLRQKVIRHFEEELSFKKIADDLYLICDDIVSGTPLPEPPSTDPAPAYRYSA